MNPNQKATGWKVPLAFCGAVLLIALAGNLFLQARPVPPKLPDALVRQASATIVNLDAAPEWQQAIRDAATGLQAAETKDAKLRGLAERALQANFPDAACAAVIHIKDGREKQIVLQKIHSFAIADCEKMQWSVFAIHAAQDQESMNHMGKELNEKWHECEKAAKR